MDLQEYFENTKGHGFLSTADAEGRVNSAVFARPHVMDAETIAFIMPDRLTHHNLQSNTHAAYLFMADGPGYKGCRLHLTKTREEEDTELLHSIRRRKYAVQGGHEDQTRFLVFFKVDKTMPLIGPGKDS